MKNNIKWYPILGFNRFEITKDGRIRSTEHYRDLKRKNGKIFKSKISLRIMKPSIHRQGYITCFVGGRREYVHILVARTFIPNPKNLPEVNHKDFNKANNKVKNLEWCTHQANMDHAKSKIIRGEASGSSKLSVDEVIKIRSLRAEGKTTTSIAFMFNMNPGQISRIARRIYWKHI